MLLGSVKFNGVIVAWLRELQLHSIIYNIPWLTTAVTTWKIINKELLPTALAPRFLEDVSHIV